MQADFQSNRTNQLRNATNIEARSLARFDLGTMFDFTRVEVYHEARQAPQLHELHRDAVSITMSLQGAHDRGLQVRRCLLSLRRCVPMHHTSDLFDTDPFTVAVT